jgi:hypothetical protein
VRDSSPGWDIQTAQGSSESIHRATHAVAAPVEYMGIDHGRGEVLVPQEFLDGSDVVAGFEQVRGKRMAEGVTSNVFDDAGLANSLLHGPLEDGFVHVMAALFARTGVLPALLLRKDPLPAPVRWGVGVFAWPL